MLAIFNKSVAKCPEELKTADAEAGATGIDGSLTDHFSSLNQGAVTLNLGSSGSMAYTVEKQNPLLPRLFAVVDDIFCLFHGHIENIPLLKQQYGLSKNATEVSIVIEAYRTLRDRGPYPADHVVRDLHGKFAFVVYDSSSKAIFVAVDADGGVPIFWGTNSEDSLVLSDDIEMIKKGCGKSYASFPKGCFFTSSGGLQSFEHPLSHVKAVPRVDSKGEVCGADFTVDAQSKKEHGMPRVGSAANWSSNY